MKDTTGLDSATVHSTPHRDSMPKPWTLVLWLTGIGSLIWLLLRSGSNPKRLAYPCQRAAAATGLSFLAYLGGVVSSTLLLRRLRLGFSIPRFALFAVCLLLTASLPGSLSSESFARAASPDLPAWTSPTAVSNVFAVRNVPAPQYSLNGGAIPGGVSPDDALRDKGVDALVNLMESRGDYFYETSAHPTGVFGASDVVVIKVNNQWDGRNGTNSDVLKGVIYRLVKHPDGFTGAVIVAENPQGQNADWYNEPSGNNSQFQDQSYQEIIQAFAGQGYRVCISDWRALWSTFVPDYDAGNTSDGYVLDSADNKLSYPKFQVDCNGTNLRVSLRKGLWDGAAFDNTRLRMINLPVLKRHGSAGATIAVKNYIGFITTSDPGGRWADVPEIHCWLTGGSGSCSAESTNYGLIGRQMARIRRADLDIVDAIWVNSCSNLNEPNEIRRQDILFSGRDPFAVDYYTSEFLLGPLVQQYSSSCWMHPDYRQSIASYHGGIFRNVDLRNVARLRAEGITNTINLTDTLTRDQELAQFNVYVADASGATMPTLTLLAPNGGETWTVGAQQQIRWSGNDLPGNVKLEYSTNSFTSAKVITSSTSNTGVFTWTIPNDLSSNALVRISSTLSGTISDTSNAVFSIVGPHVFEESFKQASHTRLQSGESVTYTIVLYEAISATLTVTDVVPAPLTYVPGSAQIEPAWKGPLVIADGIRWTGTVTGLQPVTITLRAQSPMTTTAWTITNRAQIACNGAAPVERTAVSFLNGSSVYLPLVCRNP